jgi:hypothetical protein
MPVVGTRPMRIERLRTQAVEPESAAVTVRLRELTGIVIVENLGPDLARPHGGE